VNDNLLSTLGDVVNASPEVAEATRNVRDASANISRLQPALERFADAIPLLLSTAVAIAAIVAITILLK